MESSVIQNIKKGMDFFEKWSHSHDEVCLIPVIISYILCLVWNETSDDILFSLGILSV